MSGIWDSMLRFLGLRADGAQVDPGDPLSCFQPEDRPGADRQWFVVHPGDLYPMALEFLLECRHGERQFPTYVSPRHLDTVRGIPEETWIWATRHPSNLYQDERAHRERLLETARLVFTAMLHHREGAPIGVHITADPAWRL